MGTVKPKRGGRPRRAFEVERLVVVLPVELKKRLQIEGIETRRTASAIVTEALEQYLRPRRRS